MEKKMFRYYQMKEHGDFFAIVDGDDVQEKALKEGARKLTILAVSEIVNEYTNRELLSYKGPLYFDIDCKEDVQSALNSANRMIASLRERGVDDGDIHVYCSGSKGVHILVNPKAFSNGRATKRLPQIYKEIARKLYVTGLDFSPYAQGRGNAFRIEGLQREDGNYRTPVTIEELEGMDETLYRDLCSQSREYRHPGFTNVKSAAMELLYEAAKQEVNRKPQETNSVSNSAMKKISVEPPHCVMEMAEYKKIASDKPFNFLSMQFAVWVARGEVDPTVYRPVLELLAQNSSTKNTSSDMRLGELEAQVNYMKSTPEYRFSCGGMRAALTVRPCEGCPLECDSSVTSGERDNMGVLRKPDGFYLQGPNKDTRLTTFTLTPNAVVIDYPQDGSAPRRIGTQMTVDTHGNTSEIMFRENGWQSASAFKSELSGLGALAVVGNDDNIQRVKHLVYTEAANLMNEIKQVYTAGVHIEQQPGGLLTTYVEPSYSINNLNMEDTYRFQGLLISPPYFRETQMCPVGDAEADIAMQALCRVNSPINLAYIVGWFAACHLKEHFRKLYNEFPVLQVWGPAGSGKSKTVELMSALCGMNSSRDSVINVSSITPFAVLHYAGSSNTIPRIMEEFNKSKMQVKNYIAVCEILKSAWGAESQAKGSPASRKGEGRAGGVVTTIPVTGPCLTISEQATEMPAIVERSLQIMLTKHSRSGKEGLYWEARERSDKIREVAKFMMMTSLLTSLDDVKSMMDEIRPLMPREFEDRPRTSNAITRVGLLWLKGCLENLKLHGSVEAVQELLDAHSQALQKVVEEKLAKVVATEIDAVIETMGQMAMLSAKVDREDGKHLRYGAHFTVTEDHIFLEPSMCYIMYKRFKTTFEKENPVINSVNQFLSLLKQEPYFDGMQKIESISRLQPCVRLRKSWMLDKNVNPNPFCEEYM